MGDIDVQALLQNELMGKQNKKAAAGPHGTGMAAPTSASKHPSHFTINVNERGSSDVLILMI